MQEEFRRKVVVWITYFALAIIIIGGAVMMYPNYRRSESLKRENAELRKRIEYKKHEIAKFQDYQRRFRSDSDFVESVARQNHRVFPGELVFIFETE